MIHFGVTVREGEKGLYLVREKYAIINKKVSLGKLDTLSKLHAYEDESAEFYTDAWCEAHRENCLRNFDLNMKFFSNLNHDDFEASLQKFLRIKKYSGTKEIFNLDDVNNKCGCYIMVLDKYCQAYVGCSNNIKKRIRLHWSNTKPFDRLLFPIGAVNSSVLSIDSFRALDTTRIFVYECADPYESEDRIVKKFPKDFLLNRITGGRVLGGLVGYMQTYPTIKRRHLNSSDQ